MRVATIDIGTNTVLLLVADRRSDGSLVAVEERATITRLGEGVDVARRFSTQALERTQACLDDYATVVRTLGADRVAVVGTSAMRDAGGGEVAPALVSKRRSGSTRGSSAGKRKRVSRFEARWADCRSAIGATWPSSISEAEARRSSSGGSMPAARSSSTRRASTSGAYGSPSATCEPTLPAPQIAPRLHGWRARPSCPCRR